MQPGDNPEMEPVNIQAVEQEPDNPIGDNSINPMKEPNFVAGNGPVDDGSELVSGNNSTTALNEAYKDNAPTNRNYVEQAEQDFDNKTEMPIEKSEGMVDLSQSLMNVGFSEEMATRLVGAENDEIDEVKRLIEDSIEEKNIRIEDLQSGGANQEDIRIINYQNENEYLSKQVSALESLLESN